MKNGFDKLHRALNPQCVAVVGDRGVSNFRWLRTLSSFTGKLYSVQVNPRDIEAIEAMGVKNYTSLLDIPDEVDLVIVSTPRRVAPEILENCISKEVAAAHFFTAGFGETDTEEGRALECLLADRAKEAGFNLIGPNCMGVYNPRIGMRSSQMQHTGFAGSVGLISQSGVQTEAFSVEGHLQGVDVNKSISFGNGIVLESTDFLEHFGHDEEVEVIAMYVEGLRDGRRFLSVLKEVAARKPVVIWKGGRTGEGGRAIASHTGSLAIPHNIWEAAVRQCGAISVPNLEELIDTVKALLYLPPVRGNRLGLLAGSGGRTVAITDAFVEAGLTVPLLTQKSYDELATFFQPVGGSCRNPIDIGSNRTATVSIMEVFEKDSNVDNLVLLLWIWGPMPSPQMIENDVPALIDIRNRTSKPVMVILSSFSAPEDVQRAKDIAEKFYEGGVPVYPTAERGARALKNMLDYYAVKDSIAV